MTIIIVTTTDGQMSVIECETDEAAEATIDVAKANFCKIDIISTDSKGVVITKEN